MQAQINSTSGNMLHVTFSEKNPSGRPCSMQKISGSSISTKMAQPVGHREKTTVSGPVHSRIHKKSMHEELQVTDGLFNIHTKKHRQQQCSSDSDVCVPQTNETRPSRNLGKRQILENQLKALHLFFFRCVCQL